MKTRSLSTILMSAYLSAMLASSLAPLRGGVSLAAAIDPSAAQKAFQNAMYDVNAAGWMAASATGTSAASQLTPKSAPVAPPVKVEPSTEELMARLIKYTRGLAGTGTLAAKICKVMDLCDGSQPMVVKLASSDFPDGIHYFALPVDPNSKDVIISVKHGTLVESYLTDKTGRLRAASVLDKEDSYLITNEKAAEKYKKALRVLLNDAAELPPTGTAVAGNS